MSEPKPRRRIKLTLELGADSWRDAEIALEHIAYRIREADHLGQPEVQVVSGGGSSGYQLHADEDPDITHDSYFKQLKEMRWENDGGGVCGTS